MNKNRFQLRPSKANLLPMVWFLVAAFLYSFVSSRLQLQKYIDYIVFSLLTISVGTLVIKYFAALIDILPDGLCCIFPINKKLKMTWDEIKSAGAISKKTPFGAETWLYISVEKAPSLDNSVFGNTDGKTIYAIDRPELREALEKHGITVRSS